MQYPPGANNRLAEGGGNRNNNNRLMDSQNNAKGGYGYGGSANNKADALKYMVGSKLSMSWTSQHSCGSENAECQIVIQYMCGQSTSNSAPAGVPTAAGIGEGPIRDGTNGNTPDPNNPDASRGLHEPTSFYQACQQRERNKGLYIADQNVGNNGGATRTRQNPNGARSGLECPEERDYYPYWAPSPWKDAMILTNNLRLCQWYRSESQNVKARGYCAGVNAAGQNSQTPNNPTGCTAEGGTWTEVPAFGIPPPDCVAAPWQRDNHLGNAGSGYEVMANLTIPANAGGVGIDDVDRCVWRLRYNITTADTRVCEDPTYTTKIECEANGFIWSAMYLDASNNDKDLTDTPKLPNQNPNVNMGNFLKDADATGADTTDSLLELAVNTNQYGRTFQDRTHVHEIQSRPLSLPANAKIVNLNVKGKRGNIVQTYPATEYDFHPNDLVVGQSDYVHIQWTGNDNTNNNGNNNGEGTNNEDRHNIVQISESGMDVPMDVPITNQASMFDVQWEWNPEPTTSPFGGTRDINALTKQFALVKQSGCLADGDINGDQQRQNCQKLNAAKATVDLGLIKFKPGNFTYMSSRNNNFSNRAQKAKLRVLEQPTAPVPAPVNVRAEPIPNPSNTDIAKMRVTWAPPGQETGHIDTDTGREMWGMDQNEVSPAAYSVQYTLDGGTSWTPVENCQSSATTCTVDYLPAGTPVGFKVHSGSEAGWGPPSEVVLAQTEDSAKSLECRQELLDHMRGDYLSSGAIVAIVLLVMTGTVGLAFAVFMIRRRQPPPPPPPMMKPDYA